MMFYANMLLAYVKSAAEKFLKDERGEVNVVAIVVLIAIAVVLALLLKDELARLIRTMLGQISGKAQTALADA